MFSRDIGIDLGTANVLIHVKGKGIVLNEPAVVAMDRTAGKVLAVGEEAYLMVGRTPGNIEAIRPLKDGVIADFDVTEAMLKHFINKINVRGFLSKPRMLICCPTNITKVEQKAIKEAAEKSGGRKVYLEEEPKVAAIGAGMEIFQPSGNMVIDIGGGTTDVAVLSMGDIVTAESIKLAGDTFDHAILAGASLGLFSGVYPNWATTFWDHLEVSIALHQIRTVYILDHRDCGAYREFYALPPRPADNSPDLPNYLAMETALHQHYMDRLKSLILKAHSSLNVVCHLLDVP